MHHEIDARAGLWRRFLSPILESIHSIQIKENAMRGTTTGPNDRFRWAAIALAGILVLAAAHPASAVPVFARKYHTSCQTCHAVFPKLNPFGEAFRLNGYRFPGETEGQVQEKPVSLGADAYKRVWPAAVYPSTLPGGVPLAINVKMGDIYAASHDSEGKQVVRSDFQFPQEANLFSAGTLGDKFSFFGELTFEQTPDGGTDVGIEHAELHVNSPFGPPHTVNFKIGKFAPDFADGFQEMWLMTDNGVDTLFTYNPIGVNGGSELTEDGAGISLPGLVQGIEFYGVAAHRLFYTVGVANGLGPGANDTFDGNSSKDVYARIDYKFGGMGLDGDTTGVQLPSENWREKSLRVGLFGYHGDGTGTDFELQAEDGTALLQQDRTFDREGLYFSWYLGDLNLFGVCMQGKDHLRTVDAETGDRLGDISPTYDSWFLQGDYVIRPPFQVSLRYEELRPGDRSVDKIKFLNTDFTYLIRANIKAMIEYRRDLQDTQNYQLAGVLRFAY
jgi:hypothetical protein